MYMYLDLFEELLEGVVVRAAQLLEVDKVHLALRVTLRAHIPEAHTHTGLAKQYTQAVPEWRNQNGSLFC